jgi:hypothetical protein
MSSENEIRNWEDVLNAYLEGRGLRADAEELLMRLHLSPEERGEIERSLRLADEVRAAVGQPTPRIEFEGRLVESLRACAAPAALPAWVRRGAEFVGTPSPDAEDEGDDGGDAETIEAIRAEAVPEPDAGMAGRLRDKLRAFMNSEAGEIDERVAERLMGGKRAVRRADVPDVLAAEEDPPVE